jgi:hypothetical protein
MRSSGLRENGSERWWGQDADKLPTYTKMLNSEPAEWTSRDCSIDFNQESQYDKGAPKWSQTMWARNKKEGGSGFVLSECLQLEKKIRVYHSVPEMSCQELAMENILILKLACPSLESKQWWFVFWTSEWLSTRNLNLTNSELSILSISLETFGETCFAKC